MKHQNITLLLSARGLHYVVVIEIIGSSGESDYPWKRLFSINSLNNSETNSTIYQIMKNNYLKLQLDRQEFLGDSLRGNEILISAIVSTYNSEAYLSGCLEDLESQTLADRLEIIVVDSGSEQNEDVIVQEFQKRYDNIRYIRTQNRETVYAAWNRGILASTGKYVTTANTDDRHRRDALEILVYELDANPEIALAYADVIKTQTVNETFSKCTPTGVLRWHEWDRTKLLEKGCFIGPQPMWRREVHDTYGFFDPQYTVSGDYEFWLRISQTFSFKHIRMPLGLYLERPDSIEHSNLEKKSIENRAIVNRYRMAAAKSCVIGLIDRIPIAGSDLEVNHTDHTKQSPQRVKETRQSPKGGGAVMQSTEVILDGIDFLIDNDQKDAALWILGKFLSEYPDSAKAHYQVATMVFAQNNLNKAFQHYERAAELGSDVALYQKSLGDIYFLVNKDAQRAINHYQRALSLDPNDIETLLAAGHLSISLHQFDEAQQYYQQVLLLNPNHAEAKRFLERLPLTSKKTSFVEVSADALYASASRDIANGNADSAIILLLQVVAIENMHAHAHNDLAILYYEKGQKEEAFKHYVMACDIVPENVVFQKNLADYFWIEKNDAKSAMEKYVQVLKLEHQDIEALLGCAHICIALGNIDDASDFLDCALELEPWNRDAIKLAEQLEEVASDRNVSFDKDALYLQAQTKASNEDPQGAIDDLNRLLEHSPDNPIAFNDLGVLYYKTGQKEKSLYCYEKAYEIAPEQLNIIKNLADFYLFEKGYIEEALKLYIKALKQTPKDIECLMATAFVCMLRGNAEDAAIFYRMVIKINPWNQEAIEALDQLKKDNCLVSNHFGSKQSC